MLLIYPFFLIFFLRWYKIYFQKFEKFKNKHFPESCLFLSKSEKGLGFKPLRNHWYIKRKINSNKWKYQKGKRVINIFPRLNKFLESSIFLTLFRMGLFGAAHGWRWAKRPPSLKSVIHILHWWNLEQLYLT